MTGGGRPRRQLFICRGWRGKEKHGPTCTLPRGGGQKLEHRELTPPCQNSRSQAAYQVQSEPHCAR